MSTEPTTATERPELQQHTARTGRSGLVVAALLFALAVYLTYGIVTMDVPGSAATPGPSFFPIILTGFAYIVSILLAAQMLRTPEPPDLEIVQPDGAPYRMQSDWKSLGTALAAFALFIVLLEPIGWVVAAAVLFWLIARGMGSKTAIKDIAVAFVFSCAVQAFFSAGLGLNLPAGILEGLL